jgi:hypothetical protein
MTAAPQQACGVVARRQAAYYRQRCRAELTIYQAMYAANVASVTTVVRFDGDVRPLMQAIRARVREIDSRLLARPDTVANTIAREADRYTAVVKTTGLVAGGTR